MSSDYRIVDLSHEDVERVHAMEQDLGQKYHRDIVLIAYEKPRTTGETAETAYGNPRQTAGSVHMDAGNLGGAKRGTTFGYADVQFDHYPTLADLTSKYDPTPDGLHRSVDDSTTEKRR